MIRRNKMRKLCWKRRRNIENRAEMLRLFQEAIALLLKEKLHACVSKLGRDRSHQCDRTEQGLSANIQVAGQ